MAQRDIVVIGGSAGSLPTLIKLMGSLPGSFHAAVFVVIHLRGREKSFLAEVLGRATSVPVWEASDGQRIENGHVYVAPPDRHMLIAEQHIHLSRGPKEGLHRPSINATFRSAALTYESRVIGVLLSGMLDDGASGLWDIVQHHGVSIIQDPDEARFPSMPENAFMDVPINFVLKTEDIGPRLVKLVSSNGSLSEVREPVVNEVSRETFSGFTCPECRGPLFVDREHPPEFRCRVGHLFPLQTLVDESTATQERKMYEAIVSLEEGAGMADFAARRSKDGQRNQLSDEAKQLRRHALAIRHLIDERETPPIDD